MSMNLRQIIKRKIFLSILLVLFMLPSKVTYGEHYLLLIKTVENSRNNSKMAKGSGKSSTSFKKFTVKAED